MAEFVNPLGKIRGKFGNVITYGGPNGKNYCRGASISRKPSQEPQKRQSAAFGTITERKIWMRNAVQLGFPGGNGYPKGFRGFTSANVMDAVTVEKANPEKPFNSRKKAVKEFNGVINYEKLRVAAGSLVIPEIRVEVDMENRRIFFTHEKEEIESVDCFLDDKIYAVLLCKTKYICRVEELGLRGETIEKSVNFSEKIAGGGLVIYAFAKNADGKDVSDSVCLWEAES